MSLYRTLACEIAPGWMPQNITYKLSSVNGLVLANPRVPLAGPRSIPSYGVTRPQWVNIYCNSVLYALRLHYVSHHSKILFCKFIVPDLESNFMATGFTTRDKKYIDCPACRTTLVATRFWVVMICPIIKCLTVLRVFFYFVWFVFIHHNFQFYFELCTYCNILDIYLS